MNAKYLLAMLMLMPVTLILMLPNLNIGHADTDADLCIRIMSLCCKGKYLQFSFLALNCFIVYLALLQKFKKNNAN